MFNDDEETAGSIFAYIPPQDVTSPQKRCQVIKVLKDGGEELGSYALLIFDGNRVIGFRWNGSNDEGCTIGNPQSRGYPTWTVLECALYPAVLASIDNSELRAFARVFLYGGVALTADDHAKDEAPLA